MPRTRLMAILNVTPDSFSDGGRFVSLEEIVQAAAETLQAGADILDIGGESTRPGAKTVPAEEEIQRVIPAVKAIKEAFPDAVISVDTRKAEVAQAAVEAGASIINDVSGLQYDPAIATVAAESNAGLVIMHSKGTPETMQQDPQYPQGVVPEVLAFFERQTRLAQEAGVAREKIILDPGFGFGKTLEHNLNLLGNLEAFKALGYPVLAGTSRKSFLTLGNQKIVPDEREALTAASLAIAVQKGADIVRVHNVTMQAAVIRLLDRLETAVS